MANFVLGAGKVYFARRTSGVLGGEKLIAETPSFAYNVASERVQEYTSDGATAELAVDISTQVTRNGSFTTRDIADYNLALFTLGSSGSQSTGAAAVADDAVNGGVAVQADTYYQIGLTAKPNVGVRAIESFALKTGGTTYTVDDDYTIDLTTGRLYIPAGSAAIGAIVTADYNTTAVSWGEVTSSDDGPAQGAIRFIADNTTGANRDFYFPSVTLNPAGEMALKSRSNVQELGFEFAILKPATGSAVYIDGRPS